MMRRAEPLTDQQWADFDYQGYIESTNGGMLAENKRDSFGVVNGKIVVVDYG